MTGRALVALVGAGGTIAMGARHPFDWVDYGDSGIVHDADYLAERFRDILPGADLIAVPFRALGSVAISWRDWRELLALLEQQLADRPEIAGIVITHGTATLEETAFFLHLTWRFETPLILVGAQRPLDTHGSDAITNVRAAMAVAASGAARGRGALVVMNGEIFAAAEVTKSANFTLDAFSSPKGSLGRVDANGEVLFFRPCHDTNRPLYSPVATPPRVDMLLSHAGGDGVAVEAFVAAGCAGIVAMALPPGRVASGERGALAAAAANGVTIVLASRATRDGVPVQPYNVRDGLLAAGDLSAHKVRILLMLALGEGLATSDIQRDILSMTSNLYTGRAVR